MNFLKKSIYPALCAMAFTVTGNGVFAENSASEIAAIGLTPHPKEFNIGTKTIVIKPPFLILNDQSAENGYVDWLKYDLKRLFGWNAAENGAPGVTIEFKHQELNHGNEAYKLELMPDRIIITVSSSDGGYRAVGRLLGIFDSSFVKINQDGSLGCRELKISDWPDIRQRGMMLQMAFPAGLDAATRQEIVRRSLDTMVRLGYNFVVMELGGCFESKELALPPKAWSKPELRELINYAKARGLKVYPAINSIGHLERAPQLFVIKDAKGRGVAMDITQPDFHPKFFAMLDDLSELFGKPEYIHLGTDESNAAFAKLAAQSGRKPAEIYAEFLNKTSEYFISRKIRPVIWHDMLLAPADASQGEPANGKDTAAVRAGLNKNFVVNYWCYDPVNSYRGLETLVNSGNELWVSPWNSHPGTRQLIQTSDKLKIGTVMGTTWNGPAQTASGFVHTAEYAWNAAHKDFTAGYQAAAVFNRHFNNRPDRIPATSREIEFTGTAANTGDSKAGAQLSAGGLLFPGNKPITAGQCDLTILTVPADVRKAATEAGTSVYVLDPQNQAAGVKLDGVDVPRGARQAILYTPNYGTSSRTNPIGLEWVFRNGKIEKFAHGTHHGGNQPISPDGGVISVHDFSGPKSIYLRAEFNIGDPVKFAALKETSVNTPVELKADIPPDANGVAVLVSARFIKIGDTESQGKFIVRYADNSNYTLQLNGDFLQQFNPFPDGYFRRWIASQDFTLPAAYNPMVVYEWRKTPGRKCPASLTLEVSPAGQKSGFILISAVSW